MKFSESWKKNILMGSYLNSLAFPSITATDNQDLLALIDGPLKRYFFQIPYCLQKWGHSSPLTILSFSFFLWKFWTKSPFCVYLAYMEQKWCFLSLIITRKSYGCGTLSRMGIQVIVKLVYLANIEQNASL